MTQNRTYHESYQSVFNREPPATVTWGSSEADILTAGRGFISPFDFTMQLQVGCPGGCLFCYVPTSSMLTPVQVRGDNGENWGYLVRNKQNVLEQLARYLQEGTLRDKTVYWSGVTDPYAAPPKLTQAFWRVLCDISTDLRPRRIVVQSRFRPDRDLALISEYNLSTPTSDNGPPVLISYSIGTDRNDLIKAWEKSTPLFEKRMAAIQALRNDSVFVVATLSPLGLWRDLAGTLQAFKEWGVAYITCLFLKEGTNSSNTPRLFLDYIRKNYPILLDSDWQHEQVRVMRAIYGQKRVLVGKRGFDSLARPQEVVRGMRV